MNNSNSFLQKIINIIRKTLFCTNDDLNSQENQLKKAWKQRIAIIIGKLFWIIVDKLIGKWI